MYGRRRYRRRRRRHHSFPGKNALPSTVATIPESGGHR